MQATLDSTVASYMAESIAPTIRHLHLQHVIRNVSIVVGLQGATIHTSHGLLMDVHPRCDSDQQSEICKIFGNGETAGLEHDLQQQPTPASI